MREERSRKGEQPGRQKLRESRQAASSFKKRKKYLGQVTRKRKLDDLSPMIMI